jgi:pyridoxal 5'-phosphate synthase pdxS subunit
LTQLSDMEMVTEAKNMGAPVDLLMYVREHGRIPVPLFSAGGIATPADASLMMQLGAESVFVGSGIFMADDPQIRAKAIVEAATHYQDPEILLRVSEGLGAAMSGLDVSSMPEAERLANRGW